MVENFQDIGLITMKKYFIALLSLAVVVALLLILRSYYMRYNSVVSIKNTKWERVHVQVREDNGSGSAGNKLIFDQYLVKGQSRSFSVNKGNNIAYRRDLDPNHPDGLHFTAWAHANWEDSYTCTVDNP